MGCSLHGKHVPGLKSLIIAELNHSNCLVVLILLEINCAPE